VADQTTFLEIVLQSADFTFGGRDEIEDPLDEALKGPLALGKSRGAALGWESATST
jgi:hypothetical protein